MLSIERFLVCRESIALRLTWWMAELMEMIKKKKKEKDVSDRPRTGQESDFEHPIDFTERVKGTFCSKATFVANFWYVSRTDEKSFHFRMR